MESTNYTVYIANLRAFGCPEDTVKDIILTDIARIYAKRRAGLRLQSQPRQYCSRNIRPPPPTPNFSGNCSRWTGTARADPRVAGRGFSNRIRQVFDDEEPAATYDYLPSEKRDQLLAIQAKFSELEEDLYARSQGLLLDEDEHQLSLLS